MNVVVVTQARISSSRFPAKILYEVQGIPLLELHLRRILKARTLNRLIVATTREPGSDKIIDICEKVGVAWYRGSTLDVLDRFYNAVTAIPADYIVRLTSDCPLIDAALLDDVVQMAVTQGFDYTTNTLVRTFPDGMDVEVLRFSALERAWKEATLESEREHVTTYVRKHSNHFGGKLFTAGNLMGDTDYSKVHITVDYPEDYERIRILVSALGPHAGWLQYAQYVQNHPELLPAGKQGAL